MKREAPPKGGVLVWGGTVLLSVKVATMLIGMSRTLLVLLFVSVAAFGAEDKAYRITLPDGTVEFSDKPQAGAKEIKVPPAQTYQAPHLAPLDASTQKRPVSPFVYDALAITSPAPDQTFRGDTGGNIPVQVTIEPGLRSGDTLVIRLDGKTAASGSGGVFTLHGVARGTHVVVAEVHDASDNTLKSSVPVTFHVFQHSKLFKKP